MAHFENDRFVGPFKNSRGFKHPREQRWFIQQLTETLVWCGVTASRADPKNSLRTFVPDSLPLSSPSLQVFDVANKRSWRLGELGKRDLADATDLQGGRLLAYFPDDNATDGVADVESEGYFDVNIPPFDTWVWFVHDRQDIEYSDGSVHEMEANHLVAWVPPDFIELVNRGIEANPEKCIVWLDTLDTAFVRELRRLKLIA